jgi:hypothetical protein
LLRREPDFAVESPGNRPIWVRFVLRIGVIARCRPSVASIFGPMGIRNPDFDHPMNLG